MPEQPLLLQLQLTQALALVFVQGFLQDRCQFLLRLRAVRFEFFLSLLRLQVFDLLEELHGVRKQFAEVLLQLFFLLLGQLQFLLHLVAEHQEGAAEIVRQLFARLLGDVLGGRRTAGFLSRDRFADNAKADAAVQINEDDVAPRQVARFLVLVPPL